eukprot:TRINITY_DN13771_c0_g2_i1.p1 TRINITY_DN13771_c0_g2~~TRINITY_DN13771_c0_g2_i1.p1  ORF type:complete len:676 (+),score=136.71 TRINITY_DN13771_c0_g2_i1:304-2331(+)
MYSVGAERLVYVWDPYGCNTLTTMSGHTAHVVNIVLREEYSQVVSQSVDYVIKIWDAQVYSPIQTIDCKQLDVLGNYPLSLVSAFPGSASLIVCTHAPSAWRMKVHDTEGQKITSHLKPVAGAVYIPAWGQVASVGTDGVVNVWDIKTGAIALKFDIPVATYSAVTSVALDGTQRRLITGHKNSTLCMWNTANGECLLDVNCGQWPIEHMIYMNDHSEEAGGIWAGGSSDYIHGARDVIPAPAHVHAVLKGRFHREKITVMSKLNEEYFASGCAEGDVNVWTARCNIAHVCRLPEGTRKPHHVGILDSLNIKSARLNNDDRPDRTFRLGANSTRTRNEVEREAAVRARTCVECILPLVNCGHVFAAAYSDGMIRFWEFRKGKIMGSQHAEYSANDSPNSLVANKAQNVLFTSNEEGVVKVWNLDTKSLATNNVSTPMQLVRAFRTHMLTKLLYMDGVDLLLTCGLDLTISVWTLEGLKVGILGQWNPYDLTDESSFQEQQAHLVLNAHAHVTDVRESEASVVDVNFGEDDDHAALVQRRPRTAVSFAPDPVQPAQQTLPDIKTPRGLAGEKPQPASGKAHPEVPALKLRKLVPGAGSALRQHSDRNKIERDLQVIFKAQANQADRHLQEIKHQRYTANHCTEHELGPVQSRAAGTGARGFAPMALQPTFKPKPPE